MNATIFCSSKISRINENELVVNGFNNIFNLPFTPTLFSFSLAAVISGIDRKNENKFEVKMFDETDNELTLGGGIIPVDINAEDLISTTVTLELQNTQINSPGVHTIKFYINSDIVGETIINFILKNDK